MGPIDLNRLGLRLQVDTIRIRLTADSQGGILGQLLSSLAGPIAANPLQTIVNFLNQILGLLAGPYRREAHRLIRHRAAVMDRRGRLSLPHLRAWYGENCHPS